ncbi:unnamed protein product [Clonostachys solani]|uniref:Uncharacterized protein n=1 Tax=Clonostachys solani TaxID=160281 RepID=A0A9N9WAQ4_9HYPO|nr:unnamed protein product [Clonostachys solani]
MARRLIEAIKVHPLTYPRPFTTEIPDYKLTFDSETFFPKNTENPFYGAKLPLTKFTITLTDAGSGVRCPAAIHVEFNILIEKPDGVTKMDIIDALIADLNGRKSLLVYIEVM